MGGLINLIATIVVFGFVTWLINRFIPMPGAIVSLLNIIVVVVLVIYVLQFFGVINPILPMINISRL